MTKGDVANSSGRGRPSTEVIAITCSAIVIIVFCLAAVVLAVLFLGVGVPII